MVKEFWQFDGVSARYVKISSFHIRWGDNGIRYMVGLKYMNGRGFERDINWDSLFQAKFDKRSLCY